MKNLKTAVVASLLTALSVWGQSVSKQEGPERTASAQLRIPSRSPTPVFQGQQGKQNTEIQFDPANHIVTLKLLVQDPNGNFIPNIRRDNFAVFENDVRQQNVSVEVEHAAVSLALLLENGGRYPSLNKDITESAARVGHQLLDVLGRQDKILLLLYSSSVKEMAGFTQARETLETLLYDMKPPDVSESNLYDAVIYTLGRMGPVTGRKAILLISSGIDTFSQAKLEDAENAAGRSGIPIYCISLAQSLRQTMSVAASSGPLTRIDWPHAENGLQETSGGRYYRPWSRLTFPIFMTTSWKTSASDT